MAAVERRQRTGPGLGADVEDRILGHLSKGFRQRVGLAESMLHSPDILILDEPTAGLDPAAARDVHELILSLSRSGVTVFLTTHRLAEAERLCDRVAIMNTTLRTIGMRYCRSSLNNVSHSSNFRSSSARSVAKSRRATPRKSPLGSSQNTFLP